MRSHNEDQLGHRGIQTRKKPQGDTEVAIGIAKHCANTAADVLSQSHSSVSEHHSGDGDDGARVLHLVRQCG